MYYCVNFNYFFADGGSCYLRHLEIKHTKYRLRLTSAYLLYFHNDTLSQPANRSQVENKYLSLQNVFFIEVVLQYKICLSLEHTLTLWHEIF